MGPGLVVIENEFAELAAQMVFVQEQDPIQAFLATGADPALGISVLPGRAGADQFRFDAGIADKLRDGP